METFDKPVAWEEFKRLSAEFLKRCEAYPLPSEKQVESGLHLLRIAYLSLEPSPMWNGSAVILLEMAEKAAIGVSRERDREAYEWHLGHA